MRNEGTTRGRTATGVPSVENAVSPRSQVAARRRVEKMSSSTLSRHGDRVALPNPSAIPTLFMLVLSQPSHQKVALRCFCK